MAVTLPYLRRVFIQGQTGGLRTINNTTGTWTNTGAKLVRIPENGCRLTAEKPITPVPWLTGTRSPQPGISGRKGGTFEFNNLMLIPSGTAGTAPDLDPLLQSVFGQAGAVVAATSVTYSFLDTGLLPFAIFDFIHGVSTATQQVAWGCVPQEITITLNGNIFECNVRGECGWVLQSQNFANEETVAKAGLTTYPAEPGSPSTLGSIIPGFGATVTMGGNSFESQVQALSLTIRTGLRLKRDAIADAYPIQILGGPRSIDMSITLLDDDSANLNTIKNNAMANPPTTFDTTITVGSTAGQKAQFALKSLQIPPGVFEDATDEVKVSFTNGMAHASAIGNVDDFTWAWL